MVFIDLRRLWGGVLVFVVAVLAFASSSGEEEVWSFQTHWDDEVNFLRNERIAPASSAALADSLRWAWSPTRGVVLGVYEPLALMFKMAIVALFGLSARANLAVNTLLHACNSALVFLIATTAKNGDGYTNNGADPSMIVAAANDEAGLYRWGCFAGAVAFAVHPLRVESVCWASCQPYLLACLFSLLATAAHIKQVGGGGGGRRRRWKALALALYTSATLFKSAAVPVAAVLCILDALWWTKKKPACVYNRQRWTFAPLAEVVRALFASLWSNVTYLVVAAAASFAALSASSHGDRKPNQPPMTVADAYIRACYAVCSYIAKALLPTGLCPRYPIPREGLSLASTEFLLPSLFVPVVLVCALLALCAPRYRSRSPLVLVLSYVTVLSPTLVSLHSNAILTADRYSYLPHMLFVPLAGTIARRLLRNATSNHRVGAGVLMVAMALAFANGTRDYMRVWRSSKTLWSYALPLIPGDATPHNNLAQILRVEAKELTGVARDDMLEVALTHYETAVRLDPLDGQTFTNLGILLQTLNRDEEAITAYRQAITNDERLSKPHNNLGNLLQLQGDLPGALQAYSKAAEAEPLEGNFHANVAMIAQQLGRTRLAMDSYARAIHLLPSDPGVHFNNGRLMLVAAKENENDRASRLAIAVKMFRRVVEMAPSDADARFLLAAALMEQGKFRECTEELQRQPANAHSGVEQLRRVCRERSGGPTTSSGP